MQCTDISASVVQDDIVYTECLAHRYVTGIASLSRVIDSHHDLPSVTSGHVRSRLSFMGVVGEGGGCGRRRE